MIGNRLAAADDLHRIRSISGKFRNSASTERLAADPVDDGRLARARQRNGHRILGQPVDRRHRLRPKTIGPESLGKSAQGGDADGLRAIGDQAERAQVKASECSVVDLAQAHLKRKVGRR